MDRKEREQEQEPRMVFFEENGRGLSQEEEDLWNQSDAPEHRAAVIKMRDERRARRLKRREQERWAKSRAGQLLQQLGECFEAYRQCLLEDPRLPEKALEFDEMNQKMFNRMRNTIERANGAPRCQYQKGNGEMCRAPRVRGNRYCHMHMMLEEARPEKIKLPNLGDAAGIHGAIAKGAQALVDGKLDTKQASILGYYLQLAVSNVGKIGVQEPAQVK